MPHDHIAKTPPILAGGVYRRESDLGNEEAVMLNAWPLSNGKFCGTMYTKSHGFIRVADGQEDFAQWALVAKPSSNRVKKVYGSLYKGDTAGMDAAE